jgi:hypothetical protein
MSKTATASEWHMQAQGNKRSRIRQKNPKANGTELKMLGTEGPMGAKEDAQKRSLRLVEAKKEAGRNEDAGFWKPTSEYLADVKLRRLGVFEETNNSDTPFWMMG